MSLFDTIPASFPLDINPDERPLHYRLQNDGVDRIVSVVTAIGFAVGGAGLLFVLGQGIVEDSAAGHNGVVVGLAAAVLYLCVAGPFWFLPMLVRAFLTIDVDLSETGVEIVQIRLFGRRSWAMAISDFEGVALLNLGTHDVEGSKIPVSSIVLKHPDPALSVPIVIAPASDIGAKTVKRKAAALGLPYLAGVGDETGQRAYPRGTLFVNRKQTRKVYLIYALTAVVALGTLLGGLAEWRSGGLGPEWLLLLALGVLPLVGMFIYSHLYVTAMMEHDGAVWLRTAALFSKPYRVETDDLQAFDHVEGKTKPRSLQARLIPGSRSIHTPWGALRLAGRRLPLIIDKQADYVDEKRIRRLATRKR